MSHSIETLMVEKVEYAPAESEFYLIEEITVQSPEEGEENDGTEEFDGSPEQKLSAQSRSSQRYPKDAQSKRPKLTSETPEERQKRLDHKREINRRYFENESAERREVRLAKKYERERRLRLDKQLQCLHPDLLASAGIEIISQDSGTVEMRVPWAVPVDETDQERAARYDRQEEVIKDLLQRETPEMHEYRQRVLQSFSKPQKQRKETPDERRRRLERSKLSTRIRRLNETAEQKELRLERQRVRTQKNRERRAMAKHAEKMSVVWVDADPEGEAEYDVEELVEVPSGEE